MVDANKGDEVHFKYKSIFVVNEIAIDKKIDLFVVILLFKCKYILFVLIIIKGVGYEWGCKVEGMIIGFIYVRWIFL